MMVRWLFLLILKLRKIFSPTCSSLYPGTELNSNSVPLVVGDPSRTPSRNTNKGVSYIVSHRTYLFIFHFSHLFNYVKIN